MTTALEGGEGSASRPGRSLLPGKTRYPLYMRLDGPQGRSGQVRKISPPPGFDPRTVQPVASHYTDWATRPTRGYCAVFHNSCNVWRFILVIWAVCSYGWVARRSNWLSCLVLWGLHVYSKSRDRFVFENILGQCGKIFTHTNTS